ncbi:uncharacterized protein LOC135961463 [Calliphora vicina]|uniref:uncharacterized protein LOC135961463 n=1 Tax=Calliphora vicina TaxID=7373 RepID=UPI00325B2EB4
MSHKRSLSMIKQLQPKPAEQLLSKERENPYSNTVLIGNWFEERFVNKIDRKAITPGIYGESECSQENTLYKYDFKQPIQMQSQEQYGEFVNWKQKGFNNRLNSEHTNINLWDGDQFTKNITTFKDIMYRIKPAEDVAGDKLLLKKRRINEDYMRSYGNSTQTGYLHWRECERRREDEIPLDMSHYKNNFKSIKMPQRKLYKREQRKTSI